MIGHCPSNRDDEFANILSKGEEMKPTTVLMILMVGVLIAGTLGCSGGSKEPVVDPNDVSASYPDWVNNPPRDPDFHFAAGNATSRDPQLAADKAELDGHTKLATLIGAEFQSMITRFMEEVGTGADAQLLDKTTRAAKRSANEVVIGAQIRHQKTIREEGVYRAFVLVEFPVAKANKAILGEITKDEELYTRFRESQAFKAMQEEAGH